jgi:hypothetical protein
VRSLSGGERSYSTMCFLLALWHLSDHPFRVVDEFDVFCDELTRKISADLLVKHSLRTNSQLILITPLDRGAFADYLRKDKPAAPLRMPRAAAARDGDDDDDGATDANLLAEDLHLIQIKRTDARRRPVT